MLVRKGLELFLLRGVVRVIVLIGSHLNSSYHLNAFHSSVPESKMVKRIVPAMQMQGFPAG